MNSYPLSTLFSCFPILRRSRTSKSQNELAFICRLPQEIHYLILDSLVLSRYPHGQQYVTNFPAFSYNENVVAAIDSSQIDLLAVIKSCRLFRKVGTAVLYSQPYLITYRQIQRFYKTVNRFEHLRGLVKRVVVLIQELDSIYFPLGDAEAARVRNRYNPRDNLVRIFSLCSNADSFTLSTRYHSNTIILPMDTTFFAPSALGIRLRSLTLYGSTSSIFSHDRPFLDEDVHLPVLEFLCLREVYLMSTVSLPVLPRLRTLIIAQSNNSPYNTPFTISSTSYPNLETLELYGNFFSLDFDNVGLRKLKTFCHSGYRDAVQVARWLNTSELDRLHHLALECVYPYCSEPIRHFPPHLKSLVVFVSVVDNPYEITSETGLRLLKDHLMNRDIWPDLKRLEIRTRLSGQLFLPDVDFVPLIEEIKLLCLGNGIECLDTFEGQVSFEKITTITDGFL